MDVIKGASKVREFGAGARTAEQANLVPLDEALKRAKAMGSRRELGNAVKTTTISSLASGANRK